MPLRAAIPIHCILHLFLLYGDKHSVVMLPVFPSQ